MSDDTKNRQWSRRAFVGGWSALEQEAREGEAAKRALRECLAAMERASHLVCTGAQVEAVTVLQGQIGRVREVLS